MDADWLAELRNQYDDFNWPAGDKPDGADAEYASDLLLAVPDLLDEIERLRRGGTTLRAW